MARASFVAAVFLATTFLNTPARAEWTPANKSSDPYSIVAGSSSDYNFITTEGNKTSYWKIAVKSDKLNKSDRIVWSTNGDESTDSIMVYLPNGKEQRLYYSYAPSGLATVTENKDLGEVGINSGNSVKMLYGGAGDYNENGNTIGPLNNKLYKDNLVSADLYSNDGGSREVRVNGSAIYNGGSISSISADFVNNGFDIIVSDTVLKVTTYGGAIANVSPSSSNAASISSINGNFIANTANKGGALYNSASGSIGTITGNFIDNAALSDGTQGSLGGAIENSSRSTINKINADFIGNMADKGGAILNTNHSIINSINGNFIANEATYNENYDSGIGGAIKNEESSYIGNITGSFVSNTAADGGAIYNVTSSTITGLTGDFVGNSAVRGGAIYNTNDSLIGSINGNFIANEAWKGGAIANHYSAIIGDIKGDFIGNRSIIENEEAKGGAIHNTSTIGNIAGNFVSNYIQNSSYDGYGGAVANYDGNIGDITGNFTGNYIDVGGAGKGGALYNSGRIGNMSGNFSDNYIVSAGDSLGGAIYNKGTMGVITGDFANNYISGGEVTGGAIYNKGTIENIKNSNFIGNHVDGDNAHGGAIASEKDLLITADDGTSLFKDNKANGESNAIYMNGADLTLGAVNNGTMQFDDVIDGQNYNIDIYGDGTGVIKFNNEVRNVTNFTLGSNTVTHLGLNSRIYAQNMNIADSAELISTHAGSTSPIITVDVEVDKANNKVNTGQIYVDTDIDGEYRVLVNSLNSDVLTNKEDAIVPFLFAPYDDIETSSTFSVARVIGSPYMWDGSINAGGETDGSTWYLNLTDEENPDYVPPEPEPEPTPGRIYAPEVVAGIGLHEAAIEQTRSVVHNIKGKVAAGREFCPRCGMYDYGWDNRLLNNVWVLVQGESANIEEPVDMEAKIYAVEGGMDFQGDFHNTLGIFASYRKGEYDLSGKGDKFHSNIGSDINIDSYLAGLYYRYDRQLVWVFATIYGGVQQAEVETKDSIAKFETDGVELGASIEIGRRIPLSNSLFLDPSVGVYYTQIDFDEADDNVGKHYEWDEIKHLEAELGAKLEKQMDNAKVYIKPSVIHTFTNGNSVVVTGMREAETFKDQTLGRIEVGGRYGFTNALSGYAWANYTFGSSYDAIALGAGLNYAW